MSDDDDPESKTEEASEKKRGDALERGNTAVSRDVPIIGGFIAFLMYMSYVLSSVGPRFVEQLSLMLGNSGSLLLRNGGDAYNYSGYVAREMANFLGPTLLLFMGFGIVSSFVQGMPRVVFDRIMPDLSRLSPAKGWARIFSVSGLVNLLKAVGKIAIVSGAVAFSMRVDMDLIIDAMKVEPSQVPGLASRLVIHLTTVVCIAAGLMAMADVAWVRFKWNRDLRMSKQEIKDEVKQSEGDAFIKSRIRSVAQSRARKRMIANVPKATMVIANPTHYAIALRYVREEGGAPLVVAKGTDLIALKIREVAEQHKIPVFEKKELVRAMYEHVEVDRMIPADFFRPIAELIHFLNGGDKKTGPRQAA